MDKNLKKSLYTSLLYVFLSFSIEIFMYLHFGWGVFPSYFLYSFTFIIIFAFVIFATKKQRNRNIILVVLYSLQTLVTYVNVCVMQNLNTVFTFNMLGLVEETVGVLELSLFPWWPFIFLVLLTVYMIYMLRLISHIKVDKEDEKKSKMFRTRTLIVGLCAALCFYSVDNVKLNSSIASASSELMSDYYLYNTLYSSAESLKKFGTYEFYFIQLCDMIFDMDYEYVDEDMAKEWMTNSEYNPKESEYFGLCQDDDVIVIMAESFEWYAINPNFTPMLYALANGYDFSEIKQNILSDDIMFEDESEIDNNNSYFYNFVSRDDGTYKTVINDNFAYDDSLENNYGFSLVNYYSKAKTDYSEDSVVLGNYPFNESFTNRVSFTSNGSYSDIDYNFSLPSMLGGLGYDTRYFHSWKSNFYGRDTLLPLFGFDSTCFVDDMKDFDDYKGSVLRTGSVDSAFIQRNIEDFLNLDTDKNYLSFFTTVTTHGSYVNENVLIPDNYEVMDNADYLKSGKKTIDSYARTYLASALELEYTVAYLVYNLILEDKFDDTVIMIYSDHQSYYNNLDTQYKSLYYSDENINDYHWASVAGKTKINYNKNTSERYCVPAFIYSSKINNDMIENHYITKFTQAFDLTTTLFTLLGVDYNPSLYLGYPVFDNEHGNDLIISMTDGILNNKVFAYDLTDILWTLNDEMTDQEMSEFKSKAIKYLDKWLKITGLYDFKLF